MNTVAVGVQRIKKHFSPYGAYLYCVWAAVMIVGALTAVVLFKISPQQSFGYFDNWDGGFYLRIVNDGYPALHGVPSHPNGIDGAVAFFPLYPLLIRLVSTITFTSPSFAGLLISWAALFVAIQLLLYLLVKVWKFDKSLSRAAVALLVLNPFSVFFGMVYTESLFLAVSTLAFILLGRRNYIQAALVAGLASSLRVTGIIIGAIVVLFYILAERRAWAQLRTYYIAALSVSGLAAFTSFLYIRTGDPLAFIHVQAGFNRHFDLSGFAADFHTIFTKFGTVAIWPYTLTAAILFAVLTIAAAIWLYRNYLVTRPYSLFMIGSTIVALGSGTFTSLNRYNMIFIGLYVGVMNVIDNHKLRIAVIVASSLVMLGFVVLMCDPSRPMIG